MEVIDRTDAELWASWFRALGDPTRVIILHLLARAGRPLSVGSIVAELDVGQSTVSHHLKVLAAARFVLVEHRGASTEWRINTPCLAGLPTAAELVMGVAPTDADWACGSVAESKKGRHR